MSYSINCPRAKVTSTWTGTCFKIMTEPVAGGFQVEWAFTLDYAAHRFQVLVTQNGGQL